MKTTADLEACLENSIAWRQRCIDKLSDAQKTEFTRLSALAEATKTQYADLLADEENAQAEKSKNQKYILIIGFTISSAAAILNGLNSNEVLLTAVATFLSYAYQEHLSSLRGMHTGTLLKQWERDFKSCNLSLIDIKKIINQENNRLRIFASGTASEREKNEQKILSLILLEYVGFKLLQHLTEFRCEGMPPSVDVFHASDRDGMSEK